MTINKAARYTFYVMKPLLFLIIMPFFSICWTTAISAQTSLISSTSAAMAPGTWAEISTVPSTGWTSFLTSCSLPDDGTGCSNNMFQFADSGIWDAAAQQVRFHGGGASPAKSFQWYWDTRTDSWVRAATPFDLNHAYDQANGWNPARRHLYSREKNLSNIFWRYDVATDTWTQLPHPAPTGRNLSSNSGGVAFFPELQSLIFTDWVSHKVLALHQDTLLWTELADLSGLPPFDTSTWYYDNFTEYIPKHAVVMVGGGHDAQNNPIHAMYKIDASGTVTRVSDLPFFQRIPFNKSSGGLVTADPVTGHLLFLHYDVVAKSTALWQYNVLTDTYTKLSVALPAEIANDPIGGTVNMIGVPIATYGVTLYMKYLGGGTKVWLYKHSASNQSNLPPDSTPPTIPTNLTTSNVTPNQLTLSWAASTDNSGGVGYYIYRNAIQVSASNTESYTDVGLTAATSYTYRVAAFDTTGNLSTLSSSISVTTATSSSSPPPPSPSPNPSATNDIVLSNPGAIQTNRPVTLARPFVQGEIAQCVSALVEGTTVTTQTNAKARWSDGTLKHALVSFVVPSLPANGSVTVQFVNQAACNDTGGLTQAQMLDNAYNFQTQIKLTNGTTKTVNARTMLSNGHWRYWAQGPIMTAVILEDRSASRAYDQDFGTATKNLHPIIEAWFYPQGNMVEVGATIENIWASSTTANSMADTAYSLTLTSANTSPVTEYTHGNFTHTGRTRWHRRFWNGATDPGRIRIDHNLPYLVTTGAIPHYDTSLVLKSTINDVLYSGWQAENGRLDGADGNATKLGNYNKNLNAAGAAAWIGLQKTWEIFWLYTMGTAEGDQNWEMTLGNADLMGRMPIFLREADDLAGSGDFFDQPYTHQTNLGTASVKNGVGTVGTQGRVLSLNARPTLAMQNLTASSTTATDKVHTGPITTDGWNQQDSSHFSDGCSTAYLFTGRYYYLECLQMEAAYYPAWKLPGYGDSFSRPGPIGLINSTNIRTDAWGFKAVANAAFLSPDGTPEQTYLLDKLQDNIAEWAGVLNVTNPYPAKPEAWNYGRTFRSKNGVILDNRPPSSLGTLYLGSTGLTSPVYFDNTLCPEASSPWEENFFIAALGRAHEMAVADTTSIRKFMARQHFHLLLDASTYVGSPPTVPLGPYQVELYRIPTTLATTGTWPATWGEWLSCLSPAGAGPQNPRNGWRTDLDADHSYRLIARTAFSFLREFTVDGYGGQTAWNTFVAQAPDDTTIMTTISPKWAITPRENQGIISPNDPPPSSPKNVKVIQLK